MPVPYRCPCGRSFLLPDHLAGRRLRCPSCQAVFEGPTFVPAGSPGILDPDDLGTTGHVEPGVVLVDTDGPLRSTRRPRQRVGFAAPAAALVGLGGLAFVWNLQSSGHQPPRIASFLPGMGEPKTYTTPDSGPVPVTAMSTSGLDDGQKAVVIFLRTRAADPEKTSLIELRTTGRRDPDLATPVETELAVYAVLRMPNGFGALQIKRAMFFLDDQYRVADTKDEKEMFDEAGMLMDRVVRTYYPREPRSQVEKQIEAVNKDLTDFANKAPAPGPNGMGNR